MEENNRAFKGIWIPKEVWESKDLTLQQKIILVEIDSLDNDNGCFATNKHFSDFFGISIGRVSQIINELIDKGYLKVEYQKNGKQILGRTMKIQSPPYPKEGIKFSKEGIKFSKEGYLENFKDNNTSINNTINNIKIFKNKKNIIKKENEDKIIELFDAFWKEYPKKVAKENAKKWFIKNKPSEELVNTMISQLNRFKQLDSWKRDNGQYIPYPTTWLNQKRWEDEIKTDEEIINEIFDNLED